MAYVCLRDQLGGTVDTGGVWKWQGPNAITIDIQGQGVTALSVGDTLPGGDNPCVDPDTVTGLAAGSYVNAFQYCGDGCQGAECSYIDLDLDEQPCAGADKTTTLCESGTNQILMKNLLSNAPCGKDAAGNWFHVSGDNAAHLSNDNNSENDYIIPNEFSPGTHVYRKDTVNGCGTDSATATIVITAEFNSGGPQTVDVCTHGIGGAGNLLDMLNLHLAANNLPPASPGGRWEVWGWADGGCGNIATAPVILNVNSGGCLSYSGGTIIAGGADNPHVDMNCDQGGNVSDGGYLFWYRRPVGNTCGSESLICFDKVGCGAQPCTASVTISGTCTLTANISGSCGSPAYQWQELIGNVWTNIVGETASTYTSNENETVRVRVTCDGGACIYFSPPKTVTCAPGCGSSVSISSNGCALSSTITGSCGSPSYQWQSWNGVSWVNISGATSSTYNATGNGTFRLRVICDAGACTYYSGTLAINKTVNVTEQNCTLTANISGFTSPTYQWQEFVGGSWTNIGGATNQTYVATENRDYRVRVTDNGGCVYTSASITVSCGGGGGGCGPVNVTMELINGDSQIRATASGCTNIGTVTWWRSLNGTTCANASGWQVVSNQPSCNNQSVCVHTPQDGPACYRVFFNCSDGGGCLGVGEIWWEPDCLASVEIQRTDCLYDIRSFKPGNTAATTATRVTWTDSMKLIHEVEVQAYENCPSPNTPYQGSDVQTVLTEWMAYPYSLQSTFSLVIDEYISTMRVYKEVSGVETLIDLDLSAVVYTGQSAAAFASALQAEIITQMTANSLTNNTNYLLLEVTAATNATGMAFTVRWAAKETGGAGTWAGVKKTDAYLAINGVSPRDYINPDAYASYFSSSPQTVSRTTPCGLGLQITVQDNNSPAQITQATADYNNLAHTTNDGIHQKSFNGNNRTCVELDAVITGTCTNPSYLWNGGNTTSQKITTPGSGFHEVDVTCDDGCEYSDNITV